MDEKKLSTFTDDDLKGLSDESLSAGFKSWSAERSQHLENPLAPPDLTSLEEVDEMIARLEVEIEKRKSSFKTGAYYDDSGI
jgi:hypothetical protein